MENSGMVRKRHKAEEIVAKLRQVDVLTSQGRPVAEAIRSIGVTEVTYSRWRSLFIPRGVPAYVRSGNGPEFIAKAVRDWIAAVGARTAYIEPGSPWENGYCESFSVAEAPCPTFFSLPRRHVSGGP